MLTQPMLDTPLTRVVQKLKVARKTGDSWLARCPAHEDSSPSLSVTEGHDGRVLLNCHAGCSGEAVLAALGMTWADAFQPDSKRNASAVRSIATAQSASIAKSYAYVDEAGEVLFENCRRPDGHAKGKFFQRAPDGDGGWVYTLDGVRRVLYRLPDVIAAVKAGKRIHLPEGEKDAHSLVALGLAATTNAGGAKSWRRDFADVLAGADVVIYGDNDDAGRELVAVKKASLLEAGCRVQVVEFPELPEKGDVSDWLATGKTLADLDKRIAAATPVGGSDIPSPSALAATQILDARTLLARDLSGAARWSCADLDALTGPMLGGDLIIVGAYTGNGKSALLMSEMDAFAQKGVGTLYVPLEVDPAVNRLRWAAWKHDLNPKHVVWHQWHLLPKGAQEAIDLTIAEQEHNPHIHFAPDKSVTPAKLEKWCRWAKERAGCGVMMLDHFHRVDVGKGNADRRIATTDAVRLLKDMARTLGMVFIVSAQLNRNEKDPLDSYIAPELGRLKESSAIGEEADVVVMLSRKLRRDLPDGWQSSLRMGQIQKHELAEPGVMVATCRKHRIDDDALHRSVSLVVVNGRVRDRAPSWRRQP